MRLRNAWKRPFYVRTRTLTSNQMGAVETTYSDTPVRYRGNIQPVNRVNTNAAILEAYGALDNQMFNIYLEDAAGIEKLDGVCFGIPETDPPNFEVVDILPWTGHVQLVIRGHSGPIRWPVTALTLWLP